MQLETRSELIIIFTAGISITLFLSGYIVYFVIFYLKNQQKNIEERKNLEIKFQQTLLQSQLEIKEQTLQHLATELHDNLGQMASLIKINLYTIKVEDAVDAKEKIEDTKELTRQLLTDLKLLSASLNGNRITQLGLVKGLEVEVERLNKTGIFKALLNCPEPLPTLDENATIILFRMAQEMLNNAVKHSGAENIEISISIKEKLLTLAIVDDGTGFNLEEKINSGGSGLHNLQSRAKLIQAHVSVQSSVGDGTKISIELPLTKQNAFANTTSS